MLRRCAVLGALLVALVSGSWACSRGDQRPSFLLITIDTLRTDRLGGYGGPGGLSPHADRLARDGMLFENATCPMPMTRPSHFSIMTSQYPREHGVVNNRIALPDTAVTLPGLLQKAGYATAAFVSSRVIGSKSGSANGIETYVAPEQTQTWTAAESVPQAVRWLEGHAARPFFLWVHLFDPHMPYEPPAEYQPAGGGTARRLEKVAWPAVNAIARENGGDLPASVLREALDLYAGEVRMADHGVGQLLDALEARGLAKSTVVILTADHGECFDHGILFEHSECLYDGGIRVPLVLRHPGRLPKGARVSAPVENIDIAPTLLGLAGVPVPPTFRGRSLLGRLDDDRAGFFEVPLYQEGARENRAANAVDVRAVAGEPLRPIVDDDHATGVRAARWKYLASARTEELYDLRADPTESVNLASKQPAVAAQWRERLRRWEAANPIRLIRSDQVDPDTLETLRSLGYIR